MSTDPVFSEVQKINPSAIIELFYITARQFFAWCDYNL